MKRRRRRRWCIGVKTLWGPQLWLLGARLCLHLWFACCTLHRLIHRRRQSTGGCSGVCLQYIMGGIEQGLISLCVCACSQAKITLELIITHGEAHHWPQHPGMSPLAPSSNSVLIHGELWATLEAAAAGSKGHLMYEVDQHCASDRKSNMVVTHVLLVFCTVESCSQAVPLIWKSLFTDLAQAGCFFSCPVRGLEPDLSLGDADVVAGIQIYLIGAWKHCSGAIIKRCSGWFWCISAGVSTVTDCCCSGSCIQ